MVKVDEDASGALTFSAPGVPVEGSPGRSCPPTLPPERNPRLADGLARSRATGRTVTVKGPAWLAGGAGHDRPECWDDTPG
ncbi:MAG: hypothetical protein ACREX8_20475 [Gammaproteobacteria bacterium]